MPMGVGLTQISLKKLSRQTSKTPYLAQELWWYLTYKLSYSQFSDEIYQFLLPWQQGWVYQKFDDSVWSADPQNPLFGAKFWDLS